jgi:GntR family transcriptional regulator
MHFRLEPNSGVPLGAQIARQVRLAIASGRLQPDERLPAARDLAAELKVNFHTVRKVYADLEREGLLRTERGLGTFVADRIPAFDDDEVRQRVRQHLRHLLEDLAGEGMSPRAVARLVDEELKHLLR